MILSRDLVVCWFLTHLKHSSSFEDKIYLAYYTNFITSNRLMLSVILIPRVERECAKYLPRALYGH